MVAPRKVPDDDTLIELHRRGMKPAEIAEKYDVKRTAVNKHFARLGLTDQNPPRYDNVLPWTVPDIMQQHTIPSYLRALGGAAAGTPARGSSIRRRKTAVGWAKDRAAAHEAVYFDETEGWSLKPAADTDRIVTLTINDEQITIRLGNAPQEQA